MVHLDERLYSIPYTYTRGNEMRIDGLLHAPESFKDNFSLSIQESEYTEDENGVRKFFIKGTTTSLLGDRHRQQYITNMAWTVANFETLSGKVTYMHKEASPANMGTVGSGKHRRARVVPIIWSMTISGIENLPDDIMKVRLIVRADGIGGSNLVVIKKPLISNISDEVKLEREFKRLADEEDLRLKEEKILKDNEMELKKLETPIPDITNPIITPIIEKKKEIGIGLIVLGAIGTLLILLKK